MEKIYMMFFFLIIKVNNLCMAEAWGLCKKSPWKYIKYKNIAIYLN